jgi:PncC family amidohydrolase
MTNKQITSIITILKEKKYTIGVMESCTGGAVANAITNNPGSSDVFKLGLVTYSNEAKIKFGVDEKIIKKFGVYSKEVAEEMAKKASGDIGVGVTGKLPGEVFYSIRIKNKITSHKIQETNKKLRVEMKEEVVREVIHMVLKSL